MTFWIFSLCPRQPTHTIHCLLFSISTRRIDSKLHSGNFHSAQSSHRITIQNRPNFPIFHTFKILIPFSEETRDCCWYFTLCLIAPLFLPPSVCCSLPYPPTHTQQRRRRPLTRGSSRSFSSRENISRDGYFRLSEIVTAQSTAGFWILLLFTGGTINSHAETRLEPNFTLLVPIWGWKTVRAEVENTASPMDR